MNELAVPFPCRSDLFFRLFRLYKAGEGIRGFLKQFEVSDVTPRELAYTVMQRGALRSELAIFRNDPDLASFVRVLLASREFQANLIKLIMGAFPEKRRIVFLHIPKCAGSDLESHLEPRFLSIPHNITAHAWTPIEQVLRFLAHFATYVDFMPEIFTFGHITLDWFANNIGVRPQDDIFTVVRDPIELMISQVNYNVGLMARDPAAARPDTRAVMSQLGIEKLDGPPDDKQLRAWAFRALKMRSIARPNLISVHLGASGRPNEVIGNLITNNVEITELTRYRRWLKERWGIDSATQENKSLPIIGLADVEKEMEYLREQTEADRAVYDIICATLAKSDSASMPGAALA